MQFSTWGTGPDSAAPAPASAQLQRHDTTTENRIGNRIFSSQRSQGLTYSLPQVVSYTLPFLEELRNHTRDRRGLGKLKFIKFH